MSDRRESIRRAYERSRWWWASTWAGPTLALTALAWALGARALPAGAALTLVVVGLQWRGGAWGRAATRGLVAGMVPFVGLVGWTTCSGSCDPVACTLAGAASGVAGASVLWVSGRDGPLAGAAGVVVAALVAALPCTLLGVYGLAALPALALTAAPAVLARPAAAQ